jgi:hypothetical protein
MREIALEMRLHARHVLEIGRLLVAHEEPREDAEDFGGALRTQDRIGAEEVVPIETRVTRPKCAVVIEKLSRESRRHIDPRILQQ